MFFLFLSKTSSAVYGLNNTEKKIGYQEVNILNKAQSNAPLAQRGASQQLI